ncbi:MAG TPA: valine--tRNA ligase [Terriglobales bacterium]|nr:valine--tRNA ligase [Terriglobales bacterium]
MPHELPKAYDPGAIEARWAEYWVAEKLFAAPTPAAGSPRPVYTLQLPPPNVTGRLHMGHMLNHTQMDILVRWHRMRGFLALWLPGTDHAGIATQMMVERQLAEEKQDRRALGREKFVERVWEWKRHYGGAILEQMKRLGDSVDWARTYFTMDDNLSRAVREVFVRLYEEGLIYRGKYIVNWCPRCMTAISDLEVVHEETQGKLYQIKYPVSGSGEFITVATTRPETMLGDTAVAVHPADPRYRHLHGKKVLLPLMEREIPIILDELANPEFGTGAVKVTPAHDANDFQAGLRHNLPQIDIMDDTAHLNQNAGRYAGLSRHAARERVLADLEAQGLLAGTKDYTVPLGKCDRCKTVVEPRLSTQWFVAVTKKTKDGRPSLAARAIEVVERGEVTIFPENYKTIYLNWMANIRDWCVSRQLWWGHRIPAWHCACGKIIVAREEPPKCPQCGGALTQDPDVLDTWFSSGLLPFTTLGWPEKTRDLEVFYPGSLLLTAYEILFFWVARMIMFGCHFMDGHRQDAAIKQASGWGERKDDTVPFRQVYIHALVRDAERQKMSKTKGNVLDPIHVIEKYGTDATRFTLAAMAAPGTDIAFNESRTEGYRAFANKIWNAARFLFMNVDRAEQSGVWSLKEFQDRAGAELRSAQAGSEIRPHTGIAGFEARTLEDRWILSRFHAVAREVHEALESFRFHEAANTVYSFFWGEFCDWYLEMVKLRLAPEGGAGREAARAAFGNLLGVFEAALRLLSPFMPFLTEEIWHALYDGKPPLKSIALAAYPEGDATAIDPAAETEMAVLQDLIVSVRNLRAELKVEPKARLPIRVHADAGVRTLLEQNREAIEKLAGVEGVSFVEESLAKAAHARSSARFDVAVVYEKKIDKAAERERLEKELGKLEGELANAQRQLGNQQFLAKAPAKVVEGIRKRAAELEVLIEKARTALRGLGAD